MQEWRLTIQYCSLCRAFHAQLAASCTGIHDELGEMEEPGILVCDKLTIVIHSFIHSL